MHDLKQKIRDAHTVGIVVPDQSSHEVLLAAFAIKKAAGEKGHLLGNPGVANDHWNLLYDEKLPPRDFALSINTADVPVEELRYEREGNNLTVFFTSYQQMQKEQFDFRETLPHCDLVITVGFPDENEEQRVLTRLFSTNGFTHVSIARGNTETKSVTRAENLKLLSRMLFRSREESELHVLWSFISSEDFEKTAGKASEAEALLEVMRSLAGNPETVVLLWQEPSKPVNGLVRSNNAKLLELFSRTFGTAVNSQKIYLPSFSSFSEAELALRKLLREQALGTMRS